MELDLVHILTDLTIWHWWIAAVAFGFLEFMVPGVLFIWMVASAIVVGFLLLAIPGLSWEAQYLTFAVLSVISVVAGRYLYHRSETPTDHPGLNQRSHLYIGRTLTLLTNITDGYGRAAVDDTTWSVRCDTKLSAGTEVKVIDVDGIILRVTPHQPEDQT